MWIALLYDGWRRDDGRVQVGDARTVDAGSKIELQRLGICELIFQGGLGHPVAQVFVESLFFPIRITASHETVFIAQSCSC